MGRKKSDTLTFKVIQNYNDVTVLGNVYAFYATTGFPLGDILFRLWERKCVPGWVELVEDMVSEGRKPERAVASIKEAVVDACYPSEMQATIVRLLGFVPAYIVAKKRLLNTASSNDTFGPQKESLTLSNKETEPNE